MADPQRQQRERRGRRAEHLAAIWLIAKGYRLIERRARTPVGEIDLVMRRREALVFVEVKARATLDSGLLALHPAAMQRCRAAGRWLMARHGRPGMSVRHDAVIIRPWALPVHLVGIWQDGW